MRIVTHRPGIVVRGAVRSRGAGAGRILGRSVLPALVVVLAFGMAACGSGGSDDGGGPASGGPTGTTGAGTPAEGVDVATASRGSFGSILVDGRGRTLYTFTDGGRPAPCDDACLSVWPRATLPDGSEGPVTDPELTDIGAVAVDGARQLTAGGLPLYRYTGDGAVGDANGDGIRSFGGVWHVVPGEGGDAPATTSTDPPGIGY